MHTPDDNSRRKAENACYRLNAEAYEHQALQTKRHTLKQFSPCPKAEQLAQVWRKDLHFGTAHAMANAAQCACHNHLTERELANYEFDETFRLAHYAGDAKTLYPKLYRRPG